MLQRLALLGAIATVFLLVGCTKLNSGVGGVLNLETDLKLVIKASATINPDEKGKASPVFIRMYELTEIGPFEKANFIDLYEKDEEVLGGSLVAKKELARFIPNLDRKEKFVLNEETRYVALYAEFFRYKDAKYKVIFPVTAKNIFSNAVKININANTLTLAEGELSRLNASGKSK